MKLLDRLAGQAGLPGWVLGLAAAFGALLAGRLVLDWLLPGGAAGAELGWVLFVALTGLAIERADGVATIRFWAWVAGGAVLGLLVGATCRGLALGGG